MHPNSGVPIYPLPPSLLHPYSSRRQRMALTPTEHASPKSGTPPRFFPFRWPPSISKSCQFYPQNRATSLLCSRLVVLNGGNFASKGIFYNVWPSYNTEDNSDSKHCVARRPPARRLRSPAPDYRSPDRVQTESRQSPDCCKARSCCQPLVQGLLNDRQPYLGQGRV